MRVDSRAELELYLLNAEEEAVVRAETLLRDGGLDADEIEAVIKDERAEWTRIRAELLATADRVVIDATAAQHLLQ